MESAKVKSLQVKVILTFIIIIVVISTIFNIVNYLTNRSQQLDDLKTLAEFTAVRLSKNFAVPMWDMEMDILNNTIRFEMGEKQIYSIIITDIEGKKVTAGAKRDADWKIVNADSLIESDSIEIVKEVSKDNEKLGILHIYFSTQFVDQELMQNFIRFSVSFIIMVVLLVFSLYFTLNRIVIRPVNEVVNLTEKLNNGDLSSRLEAGNDEIGRMVGAINGFAENLQSAIKNINMSMKAVASGNLKELIKVDLKGDLNELKVSINDSIMMLGQTIFEVFNSSEKVKTGSGEISSSASTLANGTSQQAAAIEEMTSSINEFSSQTRANNDNASQAQQLSNQTLEIVQRGNVQMESMLKSINEINSTSTEVSKVIKVIDEIAFQTNLLALNAAVEAARAGKYGKGFAVVAEEVRSLASRSAEAAKGTTSLIEASINEVEKGVKNADLTAAVLNEISTSIDKTNDLVGEISSASKEQAMGIDEINRGLNQINEIVQQNSSISEETAASSQELSAQASQLQKLMGGFKLSQQSSSANQAQVIEPIPASMPVKKLQSMPKKASPALDYQPKKEKAVSSDYQPKKEKAVSSKQKILVLDDDDFGKY